VRLASFEVSAEVHFGCIIGDQVLDLLDPAVASAAGSWSSQSRPPADLRQLLAIGDRALDGLRSLIAGLPSGGLASTALRPLSEVRLVAPLPAASKIIAVGRNYRDHADEATVDLPEVPRIFPKWPSTVIGPNEAIIKPAATSQLDWEVEMAVVIGRRAHKVPVEDALDYVAGYTIVNDVSARDIQFSKPEQLALSKNYRTFTPMGSWVVTPDEFGDPADAEIKAWVNDKIMQDSNTRNLIFDVPYLVSFLSSVLDLEVGDLISTGTPAGVGAFRSPPVSLTAGDRVRMTLGGVCELENPVVDEP
jgi:2-keto-4-pentenoate hydratase/2-oxohepta-3-ene-1,7-dioic acid hydratase in catechol pathway